jgi:hypothetical protein
MPPFGGVMRRLLVFTVALVLAAGTILKGKQPEVVSTQTNIAEQVMNLAVEIHAIKDGNIGVGSGVLYRANGELYVLTAAHVVEEGAMCLIDQKSIDDDSVCKMWQGEVVARDNDPARRGITRHQSWNNFHALTPTGRKRSLCRWFTFGRRKHYYRGHRCKS